MVRTLKSIKGKICSYSTLPNSDPKIINLFKWQLVDSFGHSYTWKHNRYIIKGGIFRLGEEIFAMRFL